MANDIKQNTAFTFQAGPFLNEDDGKTRQNSLTILQANVQLSKNGAVYAQKNDTSSGVFDADGAYRITGNTTDSNTLGRLKVQISVSPALPVWEYFNVMEANAYDSKYGTTLQDVNATQISGTAQTAGDIAALINALQDLTPAQTAAAVWNALLATYDLANSFGEKINNIGVASDLVDAIYQEQIANQVTAGSFGVEIKSHSKTAVTDAIKAVTDLLPDLGALTSLAQDATVSKETTLIARSVLAAIYATAAEQAVADGKLDGIGTQTTRVDGLIEDSAGDRYTAKALEQAPSGTGGDATEAKQDTIIADMAKDATVSKEATAAKNATVALDSTVAKDSTVSKEATAAKDSTVSKEATAAKDATVAKEATKFNPATETVANVTTVGTTTTNTDMKGTDNAALASSLVTHDNNLAIVDGKVDLIPITPMRGTNDAALTSELVTHDNNLGVVDGKIDDLETKVDLIPVTPMRGTDIGDLNNISPAEVNAEVDDVMSVDVHAQPGKEALPATTSYNFILRLLYKFLRNKKDSTLTLSQLYNDDEVTVDQQSSHTGDGSLVTEEEWEIGS